MKPTVGSHEFSCPGSYVAERTGNAPSLQPVPFPCQQSLHKGSNLVPAQGMTEFCYYVAVSNV